MSVHIVLDAEIRARTAVGDYGLYERGLWAGYSMRRLRNTYRGGALRARNALDASSLEVAFGADGLPDMANLVAAVGSNSAFCNALYNQGSSDHATIYGTNTGAEPRLINAGVMDTINGKPALFFDGTNDRLFSSSVRLDAGPMTIFAVHDTVNLSSYRALMSIGAAGPTSGIGVFLRSADNAGSGAVNADAVAYGNGSAVATQAPHMVLAAPTLLGSLTQSTVIMSDTVRGWWKNGIKLTERTGTFGNPPIYSGVEHSVMSIGAGSYTSGKLAELLIFNSPLSEAQRLAIQADQKAFWGTP